MPIFITVILNALAALYTFFRKTGVARYALIATAVTVVVGAFVVVKTLVATTFAALAVAMPSTVVIGLSWVVPYNFDACISARISAEIVFAIYRWQHNIVLQSAINSA